MTNTQKLGDDLYKKIENLLPGKAKRCQRIIGMFLDYPDRLTIEKSLEDALNLTKQEISVQKERARKRILKEYSIKKMSLLYNDIYKELL